MIEPQSGNLYFNDSPIKANQIINCFKERKLDPSETEMMLVGNHAPFTWGATSHKAVYNAAVLEEVAKINSFLSDSKRGLTINSIKNDNVKNLIKALPSKTGIDKISVFLQILHLLSTLESRTLSSSLSVSTRLRMAHTSLLSDLQESSCCA